MVTAPDQTKEFPRGTLRFLSSSAVVSFFAESDESCEEDQEYEDVSAEVGFVSL